jgi:hypothetical protein
MRGQLAGQSGCVRRFGSLSTVIGQRAYNFSSIGFSDAGVAGTLNVRSIQYAVGTGQKWVAPRAWEWFELYYTNNPVPESGPPEEWAQYQQGSSGANFESGTADTGSLYVDPLPDFVYSLNLDCQCYPIRLASDSDPEAIPYQWTDAVPFGAAWMALLSSQTSARMAEAEKYFQYFQQYVQRARDAANPDVVKYQYEKQPNITLPNQLGVGLPKGGGQ